MVERFFPSRNRRDLRFPTIHKAKGIEADYVLVLGLVEGIQGFPSEMPDPVIFDLLKKDHDVQDEKTMIEERRLFYVALTSVRRNTYLHVQEK